MKTYNVEQGTQEWFNLRLGKFTGTDAQIVQCAGKGLETLVYKKASEILSGEFDESFINDDLERGQDGESIARSAYEMERGVRVEQIGFLELNEYVGCSPDGYVGEGLAEFKCPRQYNYVKTRYTQKIDPCYVWQMQFQMYVSNRPWCDYVVFNDKFHDLIIIRENRDEAKINKIISGLETGTTLLKQVLASMKRGDK